ncbi:hypothetical protein G9A89_012654 [Geosiphon pyriformis]|nr:hypothetical protein G9A89_012654 [Geosiphon pyriformis]
MKKLSFVKLMPLANASYVSSLVVQVSLASNLNSDMVLDNTLMSPAPSFLVVANTVIDFSSNSSKVLTMKISGLESKMVALEVSIELVLERLDCLCSGLGKNFNENSFCRCVSFKKCFDLGLVNSLLKNLIAKDPTWKNSRDVEKTIDYIFIFSNLVNTIVNHNVMDVSEYFDTNYQAVFMSVSLGGLLDVQLNSIHKQANRDQ